MATRSPLHVEADNEALLVDKVERGGEPPLDHKGSNDDDVVVFDEINIVVVTTLYVGDGGHGLKNVSTSHPREPWWPGICSSYPWERRSRWKKGM